MFGYNLISPEKGTYMWVNTFARAASNGGSGDQFGSSVSLFEDALIVGSPGTTYGYMYSYVSNSTTNAFNFIPEEEETFFEEYSIPTAALILFSIAGTVLVVFGFVKYGGTIKRALTGSSGRGTIVSAYEDVDMDSEHSTRSLGLTEVEHHKFASRNPLNNRF